MSASSQKGTNTAAQGGPAASRSGSHIELEDARSLFPDAMAMLEKNLLDWTIGADFSPGDFETGVPTQEKLLSESEFFIANGALVHWWDDMDSASQAQYIKDHPGSQQAQQADDGGDEDDYDMGEVPGSRGTGPWTPEDDPDFEKGSSLTSAPGRVPDEDEYPASKEDPINAKKTAMEDEMEDIAQELDNVTDPDEKADLEYRYDSIDKELASINKQQYGDDSGYEPFTDDPDDIDDLPDTTGGDPDDSWDDEEGRAKPSGGDFTKSADYDMWSDDDEYAISGTDSDDPAGGKGDAWMTGKDKGMDRATDLAKKGMEKRPGGEQAEIDYQKADQMIKKYAGVDIEKAEFWAKKKKQASDAMMGEITIDGKKYKPITESINPIIYDPHKEIKRTWKNISSRQYDRKWKK